MKQKGFTIVELLIVIVVIAILAAISVVAYNGIQQRSQNAQTVAAVREWVRIIELYKADNGSYPSSASCLGEGYGRGFSGNEPTGFQCRHDGVSVSTTFMNLVGEYIGGSPPTPALLMAGSESGPWFRGAYYYTANPRRIDYVLAGSSTECPSIAGMSSSRGVYAATNSVHCRMAFPAE